MQTHQVHLTNNGKRGRAREAQAQDVDPAMGHAPLKKARIPTKGKTCEGSTAQCLLAATFISMV